MSALMLSVFSWPLKLPSWALVTVPIAGISLSFLPSPEGIFRRHACANGRGKER
jgi:hypothetical protein